MPQTERGLTRSPIRPTGRGAVADLIVIPGLRLYVYPDGHVNLTGPGTSDGYPFASEAEFLAAMALLVDRVSRTAQREHPAA